MNKRLEVSIYLALIYICIVVSLIILVPDKAENDEGYDRDFIFDDFYELRVLPEISVAEDKPIEDRMEIAKEYIRSVNNKLSQEDVDAIVHSLDTYSEDERHFYIMLSIMSIESDFTKTADSYLGASYGRGLGQVSEIALREYNIRNKTDIDPSELYDIDINVRVACFVYRNFSKNENLTLIENVMAYNKGLRGYRLNPSDIGYYDKFFVEFSKFCLPDSEECANL